MKKILIVDNDPVILKFMQNKLTQAGHEVAVAKDGICALEIFEAFRPDIMFIDLVMPHLGGDKLCRIIRKRQKDGHCFLVISSAAIVELGQTPKDLGADAFIPKTTLDRMLSVYLDLIDQLEKSQTQITPLQDYGSIFERQITKELLSKNRHIEFVLENTREGIFEIVDNQIVYANSAAAAMCGTHPEELLTACFLDCFGSPERPVVEQFLRSGQALDHVFEAETPIKLNDRYITLKRLAGRQDSGAIVLMSDVSDHIALKTTLQKAEAELQLRQKAEETLKNSETFLKSLLNSIPIPVFYMGTDGRYLGFNKAFEEFFGADRQELIGKTVFDISPPERAQEYHAKDLELFETGRIQRFEIQAVNAKGEPRDVIMNKSVYKNSDGKIMGLIGAMLDITKRKQTENALIKAKLESDAANQAKSTFLASMSHELRTPLNSVIGFSQILADQFFGPLNPKQEKYLGNIMESSNHLLALINDILDISKIDAGHTELKPTSFRVVDLIDQAVVHVSGSATQKHIRIKTQIAEEMHELPVTADEQKIRQVLLNLLSNAIKFTPPDGVIHISAQKKGEKLVINVTDSGIGILPEDQEKVFDQFYQVRGGYTDKTPGTGLGLTISKRLVEMHGGAIRIESKGKDQGCRFSFWVPLEDSPKVPT